jgi:putative FmdB family regulatory protein
MPLFEYKCTPCGTRFEFLVRGDIAPACPACKSEQVEKQLSVFAVGASSPKASPMPAGSPCSSCQNPGACQFAN